jgi:hypothetical protein
VLDTSVEAPAAALGAAVFGSSVDEAAVLGTAVLGTSVEAPAAALGAAVFGSSVDGTAVLMNTSKDRFERSTAPRPLSLVITLKASVTITAARTIDTTRVSAIVSWR